jgi:hypothetical protein
MLNTTIWLFYLVKNLVFVFVYKFNHNPNPYQKRRGFLIVVTNTAIMEN